MSRAVDRQEHDLAWHALAADAVTWGTSWPGAVVGEAGGPEVAVL